MLEARDDNEDLCVITCVLLFVNYLHYYLYVIIFELSIYHYW